MNRCLRSLDTLLWVGENKIVLFDPRIGLDDQYIMFNDTKWI